MSYNPGVTNRSGELLAEGLRQGNATMANILMGLFSHMQDRKDAAAEKSARGVQARSALAKLDPDNADSYHAMSADDALGVASVLPEVLKQSQAKKSQSALKSLFAGMNKDMAPSTAMTSGDPMAMTRWSLMSPGEAPPVKTTPGMDLRSAIIAGAGRNPDVLGTDIGSKIFSDAITSGLRAPTGQPQMDATGKFFMTPTGWKPTPRTSQPVQRTNPADVIEPDVDLVPYTPPGQKSPVPGLYEKKRDGKRIGFWQDPQSPLRAAATRTGLSFADLQNAANAGDDATTPKFPTVSSQDDYEALEAGSQYYDAAGNLRKKK